MGNFLCTFLVVGFSISAFALEPPNDCKFQLTLLDKINVFQVARRFDSNYAPGLNGYVKVEPHFQIKEGAQHGALVVTMKPGSDLSTLPDFYEDVIVNYVEEGSEVAQKEIGTALAIVKVKKEPRPPARGFGYLNFEEATSLATYIKSDIENGEVPSTGVQVVTYQNKYSIVVHFSNMHELLFNGQYTKEILEFYPKIIPILFWADEEQLFFKM